MIRHSETTSLLTYSVLAPPVYRVHSCSLRCLGMLHSAEGALRLESFSGPWARAAFFVTSLRRIRSRVSAGPEIFLWGTGGRGSTSGTSGLSCRASAGCRICRLQDKGAFAEFGGAPAPGSFGTVVKGLATLVVTLRIPSTCMEAGKRPAGVLGLSTKSVNKTRYNLRGGSYRKIF